MEQRITQALCDLELLVTRLVDNYVMIVTEGLCSMENENGPVTQTPEIIDRKARILAGLDNLDRLMSSYQNRITPEGLIPSASILP